MDRQKLFDVIIETLTQIQIISGREVPKITKKTVPIKDLPGFDSLNGIEFTMMLPSDLEWDGKNLCVSEDGTRALCLDEMVDLVLEGCDP